MLYVTTRKAYDCSAELTVDYGPSYARDYPSGAHKPRPKLYPIPVCLSPAPPLHLPCTSPAPPLHLPCPTAIPECDLGLLDMSSCYGRPENLLMDSILVPPVPIRPSVMTDNGASGSNEDDLTVKLSEIITVNNIIRNAMEGGKAFVHYMMEDWEYLQLQCALYLQGHTVPNVRLGGHST